MGARLYPFDPDLSGNFARFSFMFEGRALGAPSCALSLKAAGSMDIRRGAAARAAFFEALGVGPKRAYYANQIHSRRVVYVAPDGRGPPDAPPDADGFVSAAPDAVLAVTVADCLPVALACVKTGAFALLHSGWRGTGIAARALRLMAARRGTAPRDVAAVLGPCVCGDCYGVDEGRAREFGAWLAGAPDRPLGEPVRAVRRADGNVAYYIDLKAANAAVLSSMGVGHIAYCTRCTYAEERLGSFRREGADSYTKMICITGRLENSLI